MIDYVELHCHSYFSLLDGASSPEDLIEGAAASGMDALALTDHNAVYGAPRFVKAAREYGIKPILGAELTLSGGHHLTLLVRDEIGWANLCALITRARHNAPKGEALLPGGALEAHTEGLLALSGCRRGVIPQRLLRGDQAGARTTARRYLDLFGPENFWIELQQHLLAQDKHLTAELVRLAREVGVGYVATNNVHYARMDGHALQDVLVGIRQNAPLDEAADLRPNSEFYLKSGLQLASLYARYPDALTNTRRVAERCHFDLRCGLQELPTFPTPPAMNADRYLRYLCDEGRQRISLSGDVETQLEYELRVIRDSGLSNYFLIVRDIVRFAREQGILCQGRGSAANSLVAYLLGISPVNPLAHDLVFERFLSSERQVVPDIDLDFQADRREEVIQYVYQRYGLEHAAMACTLVTFRARSAIRDVGKALGLPPDLLDQVTRTLDVHNPQQIAESSSLQDMLGNRMAAQTWAQVITLCRQIDGLPRHLGIHNGGMVITGAPLTHRVATEPATMNDRYVVQWDKEGLEAVGLVKIDLLGLRMLSAVAETLQIVEQNSGTRPDLERLTFDDPAVYDMMCEADTVGVFQVESRAQAQVLPRLKPRCFADLIVTISLIRPGPVQGNMVHPYLRRRLGEEPVSYPHPLLEAALKETLGVVLFQEQVLKVAADLAGFTPGQGELLRRALGAKNPGTELERFRESFIRGAVQRGVEAAIAESVFETLRAFGGYSFPKSHAAAFAVLVYRSAWLKCYFAPAYFVALLNNQPMGFWSPAVLVNDMQRHGIRVLSVDIQRSGFKCAIEGKAVRLGFNYVSGVGELAAQRILDARRTHPFESLADFWARARLPRRLVEHLIQSGAMDAWGISRRDLLWKLGTFQDNEGELDLVFVADPVNLPSQTHAEAVSMEFAVTGLSTGAHPMAFYRDHLARRGILNSSQLNHHPPGGKVWTAGLVVVHQAPPTAKGHHFITLEDEFGFINVVVRPHIDVRYGRLWRETPLLIVEGNVQKQGRVTNLVATKVSTLARD